MYTELHDGEKIMDAIDCLIHDKKKSCIPKWVSWLDYLLTCVYLVGYAIVLVIIFRRIML